MTRRGYVAGALGALVLLLVALVVVPRLLAIRDEEVVEPISADDHYRIDGELTCDSDVKEVPVLPLEAEPVAVLICADPASSQPWVAPRDLVEGDLSPLVEALADLEPTPDEPYDCTSQGGPAYDLLLRFSRDRYARIHGDTGGCGVVSVASHDFFGADEVLDTALALVEEQREGRTPPAAASATADLSCDHVLAGQPALSLVGRPTDVVRMVSCWQPNAPELGAWSEAEVPPDEVRLLTRDIARASSTSADPSELRCPGGLREHYFQTLVGQTAWGDVLIVPGECRRFYAELPWDRPAPIWHPSPAAQRVLDRLRR